MRVTSKGQVTIPRAMRDKYGLLLHTEEVFVEEGGRVYREKAPVDGRRGRRLVERMRGTATVRMTTEAILALTRGEP